MRTLSTIGSRLGKLKWDIRKGGVSNPKRPEPKPVAQIRAASKPAAVPKPVPVPAKTDVKPKPVVSPTPISKPTKAPPFQGKQKPSEVPRKPSATFQKKVAAVRAAIESGALTNVSVSSLARYGIASRGQSQKCISLLVEDGTLIRLPSGRVRVNGGHSPSKSDDDVTIQTKDAIKGLWGNKVTEAQALKIAKEAKGDDFDTRLKSALQGVTVK